MALVAPLIAVPLLNHWLPVVALLVSTWVTLLKLLLEPTRMPSDSRALPASTKSVLPAICKRKRVLPSAPVVLAMLVMLAASGSISAFVNRHPSVKMLALSFLLLIGVTLIAEGFDQHIPKGYVYFAMAFSFAVEMLNIRSRTKAKKAAEPVDLRSRY